jgi:hypothetical protein
MRLVRCDSPSPLDGPRGVSGSTRSVAVLDIPTIREAGVPLRRRFGSD